MSAFIDGKLANPLIFVPNIIRIERAKSKGTKEYRKYIRNISSNYIARKEVREFVFNRNAHKCVECGHKEFLQVDHIVSVYKNGKNHIDNLQTLCRSCNARKRV